MKILSKLKLYALATIALAATMASCDDKRGYDDYEPEVTPTLAMNGEWWVDITDAATGEVYIEHALHRTFDDNNGRMYISDRITASSPPDFYGWYLESLVDVNTSDLSFSATDEFNFADESSVTITEGKIYKNAGHSRTGVVTDSIAFKAVFDYDPGTTLLFTGHKRTGFEEDEY